MIRPSKHVAKPRDSVVENHVRPLKTKKKKGVIPQSEKIVGSFDECSSSDEGFIILRHVKSAYTNVFWVRCYRSVRAHHPRARICIIDDGSDTDYVTDEPLENTIIVYSPYRGRGELLPYHYLIHNDWFSTAAVIHDSTYLNQPLDFMIDKYKFLWTFNPSFDRVVQIKQQMSRLDNSARILDYYKKNKSIGCFGAMTIIERSFLIEVDKVYGIDKLMDAVSGRSHRMDFERVLGGMLRSMHASKDDVVFGDIHAWQKWGRAHEKLTERERRLPFVKYWCGR